MEDTENTAAEEQELIDVLIAISVVVIRMARKLENQRKETKDEQDE